MHKLVSAALLVLTVSADSRKIPRPRVLGSAVNRPSCAQHWRLWRVKLDHCSIKTRAACCVNLSFE